MSSDSEKLFYIALDTTLTIQNFCSMIWYLQPIICKNGYKTISYSFCHLSVKTLFNERNIFKKQSGYSQKPIYLRTINSILIKLREIMIIYI